jgi:hypothetical protein
MAIETIETFEISNAADESPAVSWAGIASTYCSTNIGFGNLDMKLVTPSAEIISSQSRSSSSILITLRGP